MNFQDIMNRILPPVNGHPAGITNSLNGPNSFCNERERKIPRRQIHGGVDLNIAGEGQKAGSLNRTHPPVYSPVTGTVIDIQPADNGVIIQDANGLVHELRHFDTLSGEVLKAYEAYKAGDTANAVINADAQIGTMGNKGPKISDYHVHYTMRFGVNGTMIDPVEYWNTGEITDTCPPPSKPAIPDQLNTGVNNTKKFIQRFGDPLTLDLNGDGINTVPLTNPPILFDHTGSGIKTGTGWIAPDDGFLVLDRNGNGTIDNSTELFGDNTPVYDAAGNIIGKARDGFDALAQQDTNHDGVVDAQDANFYDLQVWQDLNQDGISQANELRYLADDLNITSINVAATQHSQMLASGNQMADMGSFTYANGSTGNTSSVSNMADINLALDTFHRTFVTPVPLTPTAEQLPDMQGSGKVRDLSEAVSLSSSLEAALTQYSNAGTREEQYTLIDNLISEWGKSSGFADMQTRAVVNDGAWREVA